MLVWFYSYCPEVVSGEAESQRFRRTSFVPIGLLLDVRDKSARPSVVFFLTDHSAGRTTICRGGRHAPIFRLSLRWACGRHTYIYTKYIYYLVKKNRQPVLSSPTNQPRACSPHGSSCAKLFSVEVDQPPSVAPADRRAPISLRPVVSHKPTPSMPALAAHVQRNGVDQPLTGMCPGTNLPTNNPPAYLPTFLDSSRVKPSVTQSPRHAALSAHVQNPLQ